jgi:glycosyltransferase involved in cell wall biosynthesis
MRRRTIAHVLPFLTVGGVEQATLRIVRALNGGEFHHVAFCLPEADGVRRLFGDAGIETVTYNPLEPSYRHGRHFLRASFRLSREYRRRQVDLVHCSDFLAGFGTAIAGALARLPVVCHIRNRHDTISRRDRTFVVPVTRFVFVSHDTWRRFGVRVPSRCGSVIYDGIDAEPAGADPGARERRRADVCQELGIPPHTRIVGMVARVAPQKDHETLVRAAARIVAVRPDARFLIVGDHSEWGLYRQHYERVRELLVAHHLTDHFVFTGFRHDVPRLIAAMDVFVLSSHQEGLPLVILEAMAQARPVVATAIDGVPEIVIDGTTGLLHPHRDDARLAAQILSLLGDEALAARLGAAGRHLVETRFSTRQFAAGVAGLYRDMLGQTRSSAA